VSEEIVAMINNVRIRRCRQCRRIDSFALDALRGVQRRCRFRFACRGVVIIFIVVVAAEYRLE
jgi:hypothetical protein